MFSIVIFATLTKNCAPMRIDEVTALTGATTQGTTFTDVVQIIEMHRAFFLIDDANWVPGTKRVLLCLLVGAAQVSLKGQVVGFKLRDEFVDWQGHLDGDQGSAYQDHEAVRRGAMMTRMRVSPPDYCLSVPLNGSEDRPLAVPVRSMEEAKSVLAIGNYNGGVIKTAGRDRRELRPDVTMLPSGTG